MTFLLGSRGEGRDVSNSLVGTLFMTVNRVRDLLNQGSPKNPQKYFMIGKVSISFLSHRCLNTKLKTLLSK